MELERFSPAIHDIDLTVDEVAEGFSMFWESYFSQPEDKRLGDEEQWDGIFLHTLNVDVGVIDNEVALEIIACSKSRALERLESFQAELALLTREC